MRIEVSRAAEHDLGQVFLDGCRKFGTERADAYLHKLTRSLETLIEFPFANPAFGPDDLQVRVHTHRSHVVIYRVSGTRIEILRVRHAHEDWIN